MKKILFSLIALLLIVSYSLVSVPRAEAAYVRGYYRSNGTYVQPYVRSPIIRPNIRQQQENMVNRYETDKINRQKALNDDINRLNKKTDDELNNMRQRNQNNLNNIYNSIKDRQKPLDDRLNSINNRLKTLR